MTTSNCSLLLLHAYGVCSVVCAGPGLLEGSSAWVQHLRVHQCYISQRKQVHLIPCRPPPHKPVAAFFPTRFYPGSLLLTLTTTPHHAAEPTMVYSHATPLRSIVVTLSWKNFYCSSWADFMGLVRIFLGDVAINYELLCISDLVMVCLHTSIVMD